MCTYRHLDDCCQTLYFGDFEVVLSLVFAVQGGIFWAQGQCGAGVGSGGIFLPASSQGSQFVRGSRAFLKILSSSAVGLWLMWLTKTGREGQPGNRLLESGQECRDLPRWPLRTDSVRNYLILDRSGIWIWWQPPSTRLFRPPSSEPCPVLSKVAWCLFFLKFVGAPIFFLIAILPIYEPDIPRHGSVFSGQE